MSKNEHILLKMTVTQIREPAGVDYVEVIFLESARFYQLLKQNPAFDSIIAVLRDAVAKGLAVEVRLASLDSGVIEGIKHWI